MPIFEKHSSRHSMHFHPDLEIVSQLMKFGRDPIEVLMMSGCALFCQLKLISPSHYHSQHLQLHS